MILCEFFVPGIPRPQGSKTLGRGKGGKVWLREASKYVGGWRELVRLHARRAMGRAKPFAGPIKAVLMFCFERPKSHYGKNRTPSARYATWPAYQPDLDKLTRAVLDALTGVVYQDDSQVVQLIATKRYGLWGGTYGVRVRICDPGSPLE